MDCLICQKPVEPGQKCIPVKAMLSEAEYAAGVQAVTEAVQLGCVVQR